VRGAQGPVNIAPKPENMNWNALPVKTETATDGEGTEDAESSLNLNPSTFSIHNFVVKENAYYFSTFAMTSEE
jgi:hypothetical protein